MKSIIDALMEKNKTTTSKSFFKTTDEIINAKMFLFARWISTCYADEHLDEKRRYSDNPDFDETTQISVLNRESGDWWKERLKHFNEVIYPNFKEYGGAENANEFLKDI